MHITLRIVSPDPGTLGESALRAFTVNAGESIRICRSSSDPNKNLVPTYNNAIFGCKVMSREHAFLEAPSAYPGPLMITDTSKYGTFINNKRIPKSCATRLHPGDRIKFGDTVSTSAADLTHRPLECVVLYTSHATSPESHVSDSLGNNHFSADVYSDDNVSEHEEACSDANEKAEKDNDHSSQRSASYASEESSVMVQRSSSISPPTPQPADHVVKHVLTPTKDVSDYQRDPSSYLDGIETNVSYEVKEVDELAEEEDDVFGDDPSSDGWLDGPVPQVSQRVFPPVPQMPRKTRWDTSPGEAISHTGVFPRGSLVKSGPGPQHVLTRSPCPSFGELFRSLVSGNTVAEDAVARQPTAELGGDRQNSHPNSHDKRTSIQYLIDESPEKMLTTTEDIGSASKQAYNGVEVSTNDARLDASSGSGSAWPDTVVTSSTAFAPEIKSEMSAEDQGEESDPVRHRRAEFRQRLGRKKGRLVAKKNHSKMGRDCRITRKSAATVSPTSTFRSMLSNAMTASAYAAVGSIATIGFLASPLAERLAGL